MICPICGKHLETIEHDSVIGDWDETAKGWRFAKPPRPVNRYGCIRCAACMDAKRYDGGAIGWAARRDDLVVLVPFEAGAPGEEMR